VPIIQKGCRQWLIRNYDETLQKEKRAKLLAQARAEAEKQSMRQMQAVTIHENTIDTVEYEEDQDESDVFKGCVSFELQHKKLSSVC